ncbi:MAG: hypothetical protein JSR91_04620 [Proteobacteria bacterium]|nr:hypothetical protein [Pseudomonadota bacterium]
MFVKAVTVVFASALVAGAAGNAFADTPWERHHPRREQVNDRLENQSRRINHEYRGGELTHRQAHQLHRDDRGIRYEERRMARLDGGHITRADGYALNQQENAVSRMIGR